MVSHEERAAASDSVGRVGAGDEEPARFGYWVSMGTAVATLVTFATAIATPPLSGQLCRAGCFTYPYLDIGSRFPRDYYWMFFALPAILFYLALCVALHARTVPRSRVFPQLGLALATMAALTLLGDYAVQLSVIQPSLVAGEADGVGLLTQYNPHGLFIALEELGYVLTSLSLVCLVPSLSRSNRLERVIRWIFVGSFVLTMVALGGFLLRFGHGRGYLFEITVISIDWLELIVTASLLAVVFRRDVAAARAARPVGAMPSVR